MTQQLGANLLGIGLRLVDLVDRHDDRDAGSLGMADRLDRLRHDAVIGGHDQDRDIRRLGTARAHRREGGVARGVDEGDLLIVLLDLVGADMLRNAACLAGHDIGVADGIEQRGLAVVDMAHDGHDRRTRLLVLRLVLDVEHALFDIGLGDAADRVAELGGDQFCGVGVDDVARLEDLAFLHEVLHDIDGAFRHAARQFLDRDRLGQDHLAHDLLAWLRMHCALELLLATAHRRQGARTRLLAGGGVAQRKLAAATVSLALRLGRARNFGRRDALDRRASDRTLGLAFRLFLGPDQVGYGRAAAGFFLCPAARLGLGQKPGFLLGLAAGGFIALALAALFFLETALGFVDGALAILDLANLRALEGTAARLDLARRQVAQHHARTLDRGLRGLLGDWRRGSGDWRRCSRRRLRREHGSCSGRLGLLARNRELALLGFDDDRLGATVREILTHRTLLHAGPLQRQCLLRRDTQGLVVIRFRIAHSISSAASTSSAIAANIARSSGDPPRYRSSATMRF